MINVAYIPGRFESVVLLVLRLVTGGLFLFSAWMKLFPANFALLNTGPLPGLHFFAQSIDAFNLMPASFIPWATYIVPWMEAVVGFTLIIGLWTRSAARIGFLLMAMFTAAVTIVALRNIGKPPIQCGCFGKFKLFCEGVGQCKIGENLVIMALFLIPAFRGGGRYAADVEMIER